MVDSTFQLEGINISREGLELVKVWEQAHTNKSRAQSSLNAASHELLQAEKNLSKWMLPHDAKPGETFGVWVGNDLFQVTVGHIEEGSVGSPGVKYPTTISVRQRTK